MMNIPTRLLANCFACCFLLTTPEGRAQARPSSRSAAILHEFTLPPFSLANLGYSDEELAIALANGMKHVDLPAIGSGLQRLAGNFYASVTDRGVALATASPSGRLFPLPSFTPTLLFFQAHADEIILRGFLPIVVDDDGTPATGIPNSETEDAPAFSSLNPVTPIPFNPNGLDTEDLHTLPDGKFILVDEYSPSVVIISENGKVLKRYTPQGRSLPGAVYPVSDILPAILAERRANRGFESIAVSRNGRTAYTLTQSPLGPTSQTGASRVLRILRLDIEDPLNLQVTGQFLMQMSPATDYPPGNRPQDLKVSAAEWVSEDKLLLLERTDEPGRGGVKLLLVDLSEAQDVSGLAEAETLALENSTLNITLAITTVVYTNEETPELTDFKLEGLSILNRNQVALSNDNDFGDAGLASKVWILRLRDSLPSR